MRRKRRIRYRWLPNIGQAGTNNQTEEDSAFTSAVYVNAISDGGQTNLLIAPLIHDTPKEGATDSGVLSGTPLAYLIGNDYILRRVVGKCFISQGARSADAQNSAVIHTVGIFIARADDENVGGGNTTPVGASALVTALQDYGPQHVDVITEPWLWRRSWVLSCLDSNATIAPQQFGQERYPGTTAGYGSVQDGPHIDAKTIRRVGQDDRLFVAWQARTFPINGGGDVGQSHTALMTLDLRFLGRLTRSRQKGSF